MSELKKKPSQSKMPHTELMGSEFMRETPRQLIREHLNFLFAINKTATMAIHFCFLYNTSDAGRTTG